jgi:crotonobetainyl-CoA:carnitine CoA-transferase CaiB-like acyl-CoA transferase
MIQAMGGIMDLTGDADGSPHKVGVAYADIITGLYSVIAIQAALANRDKTGEGQHIDMALLDTQVAMLANQAMNYLASGKSPTRMGNAHPNIVPYQEFAVSDGHVIVAVGNDGQFRQFAKAIGVLNSPTIHSLPPTRPASSIVQFWCRSWRQSSGASAERS